MPSPLELMMNAQNSTGSPYDIMAQRAVSGAVAPQPQGAPAPAPQQQAPADAQTLIRNLMQSNLDKANAPYVDEGESPAVKKARELIDRLSKPQETTDQMRRDAMAKAGFRLMGSRSPWFGVGAGEAGTEYMNSLEASRAKAAEENARRSALELKGVDMEMADERRRADSKEKHANKADSLRNQAALLGIDAEKLRIGAEQFKEQMKNEGRNISLKEAANKLAERDLAAKNEVPLLDTEGTLRGSYNKESGNFRVRDNDGNVVDGEKAAKLAKEYKLAPQNVYGINTRTASAEKIADKKEQGKTAEKPLTEKDWMTLREKARATIEGNTLNPKKREEAMRKWEEDNPRPRSTRIPGSRPEASATQRPAALSINGAEMPYNEALEMARQGYNAPNADKAAILKMWTNNGGDPRDLQ